MNRFDSTKDFLYNKDYLQYLCKLVSSTDIDKMDSNLVYEIAYASLYLSNLSEGLGDSASGIELEKVRRILDGVLNSSLDYSTLNQVDVKKYKKLARIKYFGDTQKGAFKRKTEGYGALNLTIKLLLHDFPLIATVTIFNLSYRGGFVDKILQFAFSILGVSIDGDPVSESLGVVVSIVTTLVLLAVATRNVLQIMYVALHPLREAPFGDYLKSSLIMSQAVSEVELREATESLLDYDRVKRNVDWTMKMSELVNSDPDTYGQYKDELTKLMIALGKGGG